MTGPRTLLDLSHRIADGTVTYPGLPEPRIRVHTSRESSLAALGTGASFEIGAIDMVANTGTYVDTPAHFYADGADLAGVALAGLADLPGRTVRCAGTGPIGPDRIAGYDLAGAAVIFATGWSARFGTPAYGDPDAPFLAAETVAALVAAGPALVGIDSVNIDDRADPARPAHVGLLRAGIPIVEHLTNLAALPDDGYSFTAAPPMIAGLATFPVRAFALVPAGA